MVDHFCCPSDTSSIKVCNMDNWAWFSARWPPYCGSMKRIMVVKCLGEWWHCGWPFRCFSWVWPEASRMSHSEPILQLTRQVCVLDGAYMGLQWLASFRFSRQQPIFFDCPLRPFEGGLTVLHQVSSEAIVYLTNLDVDLWLICRPADLSIFFISCQTNK
jgi:hypothetical protein